MKNNLITVCILPPFSLRNHWNTVKELLSKADDDTLKISEIDPEEGLPNGIEIWTVIWDNKIIYSLLCEKVGGSYTVHRIAGNRQGYEGDPYPEIVRNIQARARHLECTTIQFLGSSVWEDKLKDLGFGITQYLYRLDIKGED